MKKFIGKEIDRMVRRWDFSGYQWKIKKNNQMAIREITVKT